MKAESNWMSLKQKNTVLGVTSLIYHCLVSRSLVWNELGLSCKKQKVKKETKSSRKKEEETLPKALRTWASTALPSNLVWHGGFGLAGLAQ